MAPRFNLGVAASDAPAARVGARPALIYERGEATDTISFAELARASTTAAYRLGELGIGPGDRVGVFASAGIDTAVVHLAVLKAGAITVPLVPLLGDEAIVHRLGDAGIGTVVVSGTEEERLRRVMAGASISARVVEVQQVVGHTGPTPPAGFVAQATGPRDPAVIIYTSGTTGTPKGAVEPHGIVLGRHAAMSMIHGPFVPDDVFWTPVDWMWIGSFIDAVLTPLTYGCTVLTYERRSFDAAGAVERLKAYGVTKAFIPPTALRMLTDVPGDAWSGHRLTSVHSGGEALPSEVAAWAQETVGIVIDEIYGMTEASFTIGNAHRYYPPVPGSMGLPYPGQPVRLVDGEGRDSAVGEEGEILIGAVSPSLFLGYWRRPEETVAQYRDGFFATGDLAMRDERGYLNYRGRKDDLIMSSGHRLGPSEIERAIAKHEAVRATAVVGVPDPGRGQIVKAIVELTEGGRQADRVRLVEDLQNAVRRSVGHHAYPRSIEFVDELPRTATGKVRRDVLHRLGSGEPS